MATETPMSDTSAPIFHLTVPGQAAGVCLPETASLQGPSQGEGRDQCWRGTLCLPPPDRPDCRETLGAGTGVGCLLCNPSSVLPRLPGKPASLEVTSQRPGQSPPHPTASQRPLWGNRPMKHPRMACHRLGLCTPSHSRGSGMNWAQRAPVPPCALGPAPGLANPTPGAHPGPQAARTPTLLPHSTPPTSGLVSMPVWGCPLPAAVLVRVRRAGSPLTAACPASPFEFPSALSAAWGFHWPGSGCPEGLPGTTSLF